MSILINTREIAAEYRLSHWAGVMRERQESGLSIKSYCAQIGISANTYHYWQRRLRASACEALTTQAETSAKPLVPSGWAMCEAERAREDSGSAIRIEIGKYRVNVGAETDPELLAKVCRTLAEIC